MRVDYENVKHLATEGEIDKALDQYTLEVYCRGNRVSTINFTVT